MPRLSLPTSAQINYRLWHHLSNPKTEKRQVSKLVLPLNSEVKGDLLFPHFPCTFNTTISIPFFQRLSKSYSVSYPPKEYYLSQNPCLLRKPRIPFSSQCFIVRTNIELTRLWKPPTHQDVKSTKDLYTYTHSFIYI